MATPAQYVSMTAPFRQSLSAREPTASPLRSRRHTWTGPSSAFARGLSLLLAAPFLARTQTRAGRLKPPIGPGWRLTQPLRTAKHRVTRKREVLGR